MYHFVNFSFGKIILKSSPQFTCYTTNTTSDVSRMSIIFTEFTYLSRDVSETDTPLHSTELQLILRYGISNFTVFGISKIILFSVFLKKYCLVYY